MEAEKDGGQMRLIRVFPRITAATPRDELARFNLPSRADEADAVHVSVTFTYDLPAAEVLARAWRHVAPVTIGGPAVNSRGEDFVPGMYLKRGYVITSRGCPNRCWFCSVWRREGPEIRELPIAEGYNVLEDNLLACSDEHIKSVFCMLSRQKQRPAFTGGIEAKRLKCWHTEWLRLLKPKSVFFAYDTPDDYEPLHEASKIMLAAGFTEASNVMRCYVLCGHPKDDMASADRRMMQVLDLGMLPMAMLYRDYSGRTDRVWRKWAHDWIRPTIVASKRKQKGAER